MMLLAPPNPFRADRHVQEYDMMAAQQSLVSEMFGSNVDLKEELPSIEKMVVLLWLFREDDGVLRYLTQLIEMHVMKCPRLVDELGMYIPPLARMALQWDPMENHNNDNDEADAEEEDEDEPEEQPEVVVRTNLIERSLLVMSQLSTRFAVQYYWALHSTLQELQEESARSFDMHKYAQCLTLTGNLERCMSGKTRPSDDNKQAQAKSLHDVPKLEIMSSFGGKVVGDEVHDMKQEETNRSFFDTIIKCADENTSQSHMNHIGPDGIKTTRRFPPAPELPLKHSFGGVLLFKRQQRKAGRRKTWKKRYFAVEETMLNCYSRERKLLRSLSLEGATIWKGPQSKSNYSHSFIVANENTMFYLRASSEEQKSLWKRKLRQVIQASSLPDHLTDTQKERFTRFQRAKWFGRVLTETTCDLECVSTSERKDLLYENFFDLDVPEQVYWPWRSHHHPHHNSNGSVAVDAPEKSVYVVLPHFSHLLPSKRRDGAPRFQASFILSGDKKRDHRRLNRDDDSRSNDSNMPSDYERFLQEGYEDVGVERQLIPETFLDVLQTVRSQKEHRHMVVKDIDGGSTTGESTSGMSIDGSSDDDSMTGPKRDKMHKQGDFSVETEKGTCNSHKSSSDISSDDSDLVEVIELELNDDLSLSSTYDNAPETESANPSDMAPSVEVIELELNDDLSLSSTNDNTPEMESANPSDMAPSPGFDDVPGTVNTNSSDYGDALANDNDTSFCVELELLDQLSSNPGQQGSLERQESFSSDDGDDVSLSENLKYSILPRKTKGVVALQTRRYRSEEMIALQLSKYYESLFAGSMIWLRTPRVQRLNLDTVITEVPRNAITLAEAKKSHSKSIRSLLDYLIAAHGPLKSEEFAHAQMCFAQSLAGVSILTHVLGIKDRHDGNIMIDERGHVFVSDFSWVFGNDPDTLSSAMERAPFKLTKEYMDVLGGPDSESFDQFRSLFLSGMKMAHDDAMTAISFVEAVCDTARRQGDKAVRHLQKKLLLKTPEHLLEQKMLSLIERSQLHLMTSAYDVLSKPKTSSRA